MLAERGVRIDKWLWAARVFGSRSLAIQACNAGHVKIGGLGVKPSRPVRVGDRIDVWTGQIQRTLKVTAMLDRRVGAKVLSQFVEDLTPVGEYERARLERLQNPNTYPKGIGRPTKRLRRRLMGIE